MQLVRPIGAKLVPNALNSANLDEGFSFLILRKWQKLVVLGILNVLRLERGGTLNQRVTRRLTFVYQTAIFGADKVSKKVSFSGGGTGEWKP